MSEEKITGNCCGRPMEYAKEPQCNYTDACMDEYCCPKLGSIKETEPDCKHKAVIPSVTVDSVEGITNLANCFVHVNDINTTFYIDDKHRPMITWAGPVDIPGYDMEHNPEGFRDQIVTDKEKNIAVIYDKHGKGYTFGIEQGYDITEIINNKLEQMAADGELQDLIQTYLDSYAMLVFDTVTDMKASDALFNGSYAQTLGFHSLNDGGGATYYITDTGTANEMDVIAVGDLYANLVIEATELNVKQFGAYGDNSHDDLTSIQAAIDYGRANNYYNVYIPSGNYIVSNAIEIPQLMRVYGNNWDTTFIIKNTNNLNPTDNVDAVIIFRKTADYATRYTQRQQLEQITILGNDTTGYGIYCPTECPRTYIHTVKMQKIQTGIKIASGWLFTIENVSINPKQNGFDIRGSSTTLNLKNTYVNGGEGIGYYLRGISYSGFENIACDGNKGTPYKFEYCNITIDGFGCECQQSSCAIEITNSRIDFNAGTIIVNPTSADYRCIKIGSNSYASFTNFVFHDFGENNTETPGMFLSCGSDGSVSFTNCTADKKFSTANYYYDIEDSQFLNSRNGSYFTNGNASYSAIGYINKDEDTFMTLTNQDFHMGGIIFNNRGNARYSLDGVDRRYKRAHNLGDIFINQAPALNGIAMLQQTSDSEPREMAGTVTSVNISGTTGTITMTTLDLTDFSKNRGLVIETGHNIESSSGGTATISAIDTGTSTITLSSVSGTFAVNDTIIYKGITNIGSSTYSNIQSIGYGTTAQRPGSPVNGYMYWDTTLGKPIWRVGNNWKDATGTNV